MSELAFIADTPVQVLNCIRLRQGVAELQDRCDIFIGLQFADAEEIAKRLKATGLFEHVFTYLPEIKDAVGWATKARYIAKPQARLVSMLVDEIDPSRLSDYTTIFMSLFTRFAVALRFFNKKAETIFYDDGIGSYNDGIFSLGDSAKRRFAYGLFGYRFSDISPHVIYLTSPGFAQYQRQDIEKREIPRETSVELQETIAEVFAIGQAPEIPLHQLTYFTQPAADDPLMASAVSQTDDALIASGVDALVRRHPREPQVPLGNFALDTSHAMWEIVASTCVDDDSVLMTVFSTTLFVPKLSYDMEPRLVFTYKLSYKGEAADRMDGLVKRLRARYRDPSKIVTPECRADLDAILQNIRKR